jgi:hypothetical protein
MAGKKVAAEQVTFGQKPVKNVETGRGAANCHFIY